MRTGRATAVLRSASALLLAAAAAASADPGLSAAGTTTPDADERFELRLGAGAARRGGAQQRDGQSLDFTGVSIATLDLSGWVWALAQQRVGLLLDVAREDFGLVDASGRALRGGLWRLRVAPTFRLALGRVRLEPQLGLALDELPDFGALDAPTFTPARRQAVLLAARVVVPLGRVTLEARGEYLAALAAADGRGQPAVSGGYALGGVVRVPVSRQGRLLLSGLFQASWSEDRLAGGGSALGQSIARAGLSLDASWVEARRPWSSAELGRVRVRVLDAASREPLPGASITLQTQGGQRSTTTSATGEALLDAVTPGDVSARAEVKGHVAGEASSALDVSGVATLELWLPLVVPTPGRLRLSVTDKASGKPLAGVRLAAGPATALTDATGTATLGNLAAGPLEVRLAAEGYLPDTEAVVVVEGIESTAEVQLLSATKRVPATLTGLVRSAGGGAPVAAELVLTPGGRHLKADGRGAFTLTLPAGAYTLTVSAPGFVPQAKPFTVKDAEQAIFNFDLAPR